ncbi:MAG: hypothetical protein Greene101449_1176 [Candidatus Peregrinibacteria bacterium Greene1014_49]|nr:MAG: hypothetical protein Greene101449_1176 [Candidatus Peregrinibacteria bacterium Greene1014_49]
MQHTVHTEADNRHFLLRLEVDVGCTKLDGIIDDFLENARSHLPLLLDNLLKASSKWLAVRMERRIDGCLPCIDDFHFAAECRNRIRLFGM